MVSPLVDRSDRADNFAGSGGEIERSHRQRYHSLLAEALRAAYPADPDAADGEQFTAD